ncbi:MAG: peptide chain release factor N(5)-glutamine methyltransferase [Patescibacteria group bacterium]|jgi:release factor glutamine methyltransferase
MQINELIGQAKIDCYEAELLLGHVLKQDQVYLRIHGDKTVTPSAIKKFKALINRRLKHEPIAYLVKSQPFMGREFAVDRNVLIPRPETEILSQLVEQHLKGLPGHRGLRGRASGVIVDIGTGSGCLAVTLALAFPKARVIASDISTKALAIAKQNAKKNRATIEFIKDNLFGEKVKSNIEYQISSMTAKRTFDIQRSGHSTFEVVIVANLPYLPVRDKKTMMPDVAKYEPAKALFAGKDGSALVRKLLNQIRHSKFDIQTSTFLEIDPPQAKGLCDFAKKLFPNKKVQIKKDLCGKDRFLIVI